MDVTLEMTQNTGIVLLAVLLNEITGEMKQHSGIVLLAILLEDDFQGDDTVQV